MAKPIKTAQGNWRIMIEVKGVRKSKTFPTPEAATRWGDLEKARITKQKAIAAEVINQALGTSLPKRVLEAMAETKYTHQDIADAAMPIGTNCGLYFLLKDGVVVYVGQSRELIYRIGRHLREGEKSFDAFTYMQCEPEELNRLEELYIRALVPRYNLRLSIFTKRKVG